MSQQTLVFELGSEELPPKALPKLAAALAQNITAGLNEAKLSFGQISWYASPRRLAVEVTELVEQQDEQHIERRGPALQAAYTADGEPTKAALGFARSCGIQIADLQTVKTDKGEWLYHSARQPGQASHVLLPDIIKQAVAKLPIPKPMRWGASDIRFIRPVHWALLLLGNQVIECEILGQTTGRVSYGHRFHAPEALTLEQAADYLDILQSKGKVITHFQQRHDKIKAQILALADSQGATAVIDDELLDEVTSLVEWPVALLGQFDKQFLQVPAEALISTMKDNQKYFHLLDSAGQLLPCFIFISNIESRDPRQVIAGNEKVVRPRLADAEFFFVTDRKRPLADRLPELEKVIYQKKLGSLADKSRRVARLAQQIARLMGAEVASAERAALLCKADLMTEMVMEFPEVQGVMGMHYAQHDGEDPIVAQAIYEHYLPRFAGDSLPESQVGLSVALADRLDTLVGIFGINQRPTGDKDPFALRRAALAVMRLVIESSLTLDLAELIQFAAEGFAEQQIKLNQAALLEFCFERLRTWLHDQGISQTVFQSVAALQLTIPLDFYQRIQAVAYFAKLDEAEALAAANKRVANILAKQSQSFADQAVAEAHLVDTAERDLWQAISQQQAAFDQLLAANNYQQILTDLAKLKPAIDLFFDKVMVMVDDEMVRNNRLAMLYQLRRLFISVADISLLQY